MTQCTCTKPDTALVNGVFMGSIPSDGDKIKPFIGKFICYHCGGEVTPEVGQHDYSSVTATTVLHRLKELGVA